MPSSASGDDLQRRAMQLVRDIVDYPKPGIVFKDITPLLADAPMFAAVTTAMSEPFAGARITHVVAIESRGFIVGAPVAQRLGAAFVPVRKPGKLPAATRRQDYDLEYGIDALEIHADALAGPEARVLIVDDVLATGGTAAATCALVESLGATVVGFSFLITLGFLPGVARLSPRRLVRVIEY